MFRNGTEVTIAKEHLQPVLCPIKCLVHSILSSKYKDYNVHVKSKSSYFEEHFRLPSVIRCHLNNLIVCDADQGDKFSEVLESIIGNNGFSLIPQSF